MKYFILATTILLGSCTWQYGPTDPSRQVLFVCESWTSIFDRITTRRKFGLASDAEIKAINEARPLLNPVCTVEPEDRAAFDLVTLENALLAIIAAEKNQ